MVGDYYYSGGRSEIVDLLASLIVLGIAFSMKYIMLGDFNRIMVSFLAVSIGFLVHELAHRYTARYFGAFSRYRAWYIGLAIALAIAIVSRGNIIFAAPGAVEVVLPWYSSRIESAISVSGPFANIVVALICIAIRAIPHTTSLHWYVNVIGYVNAFLGFFNLLPIPPLDGYKVMRGGVVRWGILFLLSALILLFYYS